MFKHAFSIWSGTADHERLAISLTRRSKGRLGVPPGGAEQGNASRRRGMVPGKCGCNFRRRLFLGVFPTADKSRRTRPGTEITAKMRQSRKKTYPASFFFVHSFQFINNHCNRVDLRVGQSINIDCFIICCPQKIICTNTKNPCQLN